MSAFGRLAEVFVAARATGRALPADFKKIQTQVAAQTTALQARMSAAAGAAGAGGVLGQIFNVKIAGAIAAALGTKVAASFEQSMVQVRVNMRLLGKEGEEAFGRLKAAAEHAGATTKFTAAQSADALNQMGLGGLSASDAIGALPAVLQLAAATGMEMGQSATVIVDAMAKFRIEAKDAVSIVDQLISAQTRAVTTAAQLAEAHTAIGAVASSLGLSYKETTAILATMAKGGVRGAKAGTSLKIGFAKLLDGTKETNDVLNKLNIDFNSFLDDTGKIKDAIGLMNAFAKSAMTPGDALAIFGMKGANMLAMLDAMRDPAGFEGGMNFLEKTFKGLGDDAGIGAKAAEAMMDTFIGSLLKMKSAVEAAAISLFGPLLGGIGTVAMGITTFARAVATLNNALGGIPSQLIGVIAAFALWSKVIMLLRVRLISLGVAAGLSSSFQVLTTTMLGLGTSVIATLGPYALLAGAILLAFKVIKFFVAEVREALKDSPAIERLKKAWEGIKDQFMKLFDQVVKVSAAFVEKLLPVVEFVVDVVADVVEALIFVAAGLLELVGNWIAAWGRMAMSAELTFKELVDNADFAWNAVTGAVLGAMKAQWFIVKRFTSLIIEAFRLVGKAAFGSLQGATAGVQAFLTGGDFSTAFMEEFNKQMGDAFAKLSRDAVNIGADANKVFLEEFNKGLNKKTIFEDDIKALRNAMKESDEAQAQADAAEPPAGEEKPPAAGAAGAAVDAAEKRTGGFIGLEEAFQRTQEALLKDQGDDKKIQEDQRDFLRDIDVKMGTFLEEAEFRRGPDTIAFDPTGAGT